MSDSTARAPEANVPHPGGTPPSETPSGPSKRSERLAIPCEPALAIGPAAPAGTPYAAFAEMSPRLKAWLAALGEPLPPPAAWTDARLLSEADPPDPR